MELGRRADQIEHVCVPADQLDYIATMIQRITVDQMSTVEFITERRE